MGNSVETSKLSTSLLPNEISDFQSLTSFPGEILIKLHNHYKKFSSCLTDDGVIDYKEFNEIMRKDNNMSRRIFNAVDINKDGVINFREFLKYISCFINGNFEEKISLSFKLFCNEDSRTITKDTMIELLKDILLEEDPFIREFFNLEEVISSVTQTFAEVSALIQQTEIVKETAEVGEVKRKLSKKQAIPEEIIDYEGYKLFIEKHPSILNWLVVDLEKIKAVSQDSKKANGKKVTCFGC